MELRVRVRVAQPRRGFFLTLVSSITTLGLFVWLHAQAPFQGAKILGLTMGAGYAIAIVAMLSRAARRPAERRGWILLSLGSLFAAAKTLLLTLTPGHRLPISDGELVLALLLTLGAAILTSHGMLSWPGQRHGGAGPRDQLLNGLGGVFLGASLWLLFWMGGTWHDGFQGHSVHHVHVLFLGFQVAVSGGVAGYLFLACPRRGAGPIGVMLMGGILVTTLFGVISILAGQGEHNIGFALLPGYPLVLALAASLAHPVEQCLNSGHPDRDLPEMVPFVPFLLLGPVLALALWREGGVVLWPAVSLLAITGLLILRQILLLRELKTSNYALESRVEERTRNLRELQTWQLRYERMNTLALLGAGMIHDLNNALGVVQGSVDLMLRDATEVSPSLRNHCHRIQRATHQLSGLGQRVMGFARREIESPHLMNLAEGIRQVEPLLKILASRSIRLSIDIEEALPKVVASQALIEQALVNLVSNARDAMPDGGDLRVRAFLREGDPGAVVIAVSDTGPGIPRDVRARLFTPFFTTKGSGRGTGLGLASTRALMLEVGGNIFLEPKEGAGTTFTLVFPVRAEAPALATT